MQYEFHSESLNKVAACKAGNEGHGIALKDTTAVVKMALYKDLLYLIFRLSVGEPYYNTTF